MDLEHTNNLAMPLLIPNQSGKEITHNEALVILDNIVQKSVVDKDLSTPPENPENNALYIVGQNAINEWENKENYLSYFDNGWRFITPKNGFVFFIEDENKLYNFNGTSWVELAPNFTPSITSLQNLSHIGINTTADSTNKLTVKSDSVLFDNATTNSTVKINKNTENNTASITLQSDNTSKAEFGLIANDNLTLKVSSDGENWNNAFVVDKTTGNIDFKGTITNNGNEVGNNSFFPTSNNIDFSLLDSGGSYVVPEDGWFSLSKKGGGTIIFENITKQYSASTYRPDQDYYISFIFPVSKNDEIKIFYNMTGETNYLKFIYI